MEKTMPKNPQDNLAVAPVSERSARNSAIDGDIAIS